MITTSLKQVKQLLDQVYKNIRAGQKLTQESIVPLLDSRDTIDDLLTHFAEQGEEELQFVVTLVEGRPADES